MTTAVARNVEFAADHSRVRVLYVRLKSPYDDHQAFPMADRPDTAYRALVTKRDRGGRAFVAALNEVTLADLLGNRQMKQQFKRIDIREHRS